MLDFLGIGAQKCGTSWLFENLKRHPAVRFPAGKEVHFWDRRRNRDSSLWTALFPPAALGIKQGEITPAYALLDNQSISHISLLFPRLRIFYTIRNPIARAWSHALMAVKRSGTAIDTVPDSWFLEHFASSASRRRGSFTACLDSSLTTFSQEQLHVIIFDEIVAAPQGVLVDLAHHLDIDSAFYRNMDLADLQKPVFQGLGIDLRPALLETLRSTYSMEIYRLSSFLGKDLTSWIRWDGRGRQSPSLHAQLHCGAVTTSAQEILATTSCSDTTL